MQKILIALVALLILTSAGIYIASQKQPAPEEKATLTTVTKTIKQESKEPLYTIDVEYPQIEGIEVGKDMNTKVTALVEKMTNAFKKTVAQATPLVIDGETLPSGLTIRYKTDQVSPEVVSIELLVSDYQSGAAHPNNYTKVFNYDVAQKREIQLSDLFTKESNYLKTLSTIAKEQITAQLQKDGMSGDEQMITDGTQPTAENFQLFAIRPNSLILIFDPYQVAPYVAGTRKVTIPAEQLTQQLSGTGKRLLTQ